MCSREQWVVLALISGTWALAHWLWRPIAFLKIMLESEFHLAVADLAWLDLSFWLPLALVQILLADRIACLRPVNSLSLCLISASMGMMATGNTDRLFLCCLCLAASGASQAFVWPACAQILWIKFNARFLATIAGLLNSVTILAAGVSMDLVCYVSDRSSWRLVFVPVCLLCLLDSVLLNLCIKPPLPEDLPPLSLGHIWAVPAVVDVCAAAFCLKLASHGLSVRLPLFLSQELSYSHAQIDHVSVLLGAGAAVAAPMMGFATDCWSQRTADKLRLIVYMVGAAAVAVALLLVVFQMLSPVPDGWTVAVVLIGSNAALESGQTLLIGSLPLHLSHSSGTAVAGVASLVSGMANAGFLLEGSMFGFAFTHFRWGGVLALMALLLWLGVAFLFRAHFKLN